MKSGPPGFRIELLPLTEEPAIGSDGAVRSHQDARLSSTAEALAELRSPAGLEILARSYWNYLERRTGGLIQVVYSPGSRRVALISPRLTLLRFGEPVFDSDGPEARVTWPIRDGLLVARPGYGRGHLRLTLTDAGETTLIRSEIADYHPRLRGRGIAARAGAWTYRQTQLRIHTSVTRGFLRSLARPV